MTDPASIRMADLDVDRHDDRIRAALLAAGYIDPPAIGDQYRDITANWLPDGHAHIVTITGIWHVVSGWTVIVQRREVDANDDTVPSRCGEGSIYINRLTTDFERWRP